MPTVDEKAVRVWVLADDRAGNVSQCVGVAEALGWSFAVKQIRYDRLGGLPNALRGAGLLGITAESRAALAPPWPQVVIAAGRRTAPVARWLKRQAGAFLVQIMDPGSAGRSEFDLIAIPGHDRIRHAAANALITTGAPHRVTQQRLAAEAELWWPRLAHLPRPWLAVIVGGSTHQRPFPVAMARALGEQAAELASAAGGSLLLTTSRRTGAEQEQALVAASREPHFLHLWSGGGDNPFFGFLALADAIVVTGDSVSMCCEACSAPAPVYVYAPPGWAVDKHARLHAMLYERGLARPLEGVERLESWSHPPLNAAADIAAAIRARVSG
jgi:mitochondrial fission protein ELM1